MRRRVLGLLAAVVLVVVAVVAIDDGGKRTYRVAAIFDTAKGMVAGQQVKIAGAVVGRVSSVDLAPGPKARVVMSVDRRFAPFRQNASCRLLPEGIISESFVACDPGSSSRPALSRGPGGTPTVPLARTAVPTSLQDLLDVFAAPTSDRVRLLINELGLATAGRGEDLNALLRRANPTLAQTSRLLRLLNGQQASIDDGIAQTDRVLADLASRSGALRRLVSRVAAVTSTTADRKRALSEAVRRLPPLLDEARPALASLSRAMDESTPLLRALRTAAPSLAHTNALVPPFATAAGSTLRELSRVADAGRTTVSATRDLSRHLRAASAKSVPFGRDTDALLRDVRDRGGLEGALRWLYGLATATAGYDSTSHFVAGLLHLLPQCVLSATFPGCTTKYNSAGNGTIPPDDPSCGPVTGAPWDPPTTCSSKTPGGRRTGKRRPSSRPSLRPKLPSARPHPPVTLPLLPLPAQRRPDPETAAGVGGLLDYLLGP